MSKIPRYLKKGDTIGLIAPAGFMAVDKLEACIETLDSWGYTVRMGATTHSNSTNYFSGTDDERLADLQQMLDDRSISAILCVRGGYGTSRLIDRLDFKKFRKHPKWIIGYSDITALHMHLLSNYKIASLHAPMAAAFADDPVNNPYIRAWKDAIEGKPAHYECTPHELNRIGEAKGQIVGGNLALLTHVIGTDSDFKTKKRILFIEDVGEYQYAVDRMLLQLRRAGKLDHLAGLIVGGFTDSKDTERPFGQPLHDMIYAHVADFSYPICFGFPVSHERENYALKIGMKYHLQVSADRVNLIEDFA